MKARVRATLVPALWHLGASLFLAVACAALVFGVWYPAPYDEWVGGRHLFFLLVGVDVIIGPLLTAIVFNPAKPKAELWRDLSVIVILQLSALMYGVSSVYQARPVFLAFEEDRFRVVTATDIDPIHLTDAPNTLQQLPRTGPQLLGVRLTDPRNEDYLHSIELAIRGLHPAFRPSHWLPYTEVRKTVTKNSAPIAQLLERSPEHANSIKARLAKLGLNISDVAYLPVIAGKHTDWIVLINTHTGDPVGFAHVDGW